MENKQTKKALTKTFAVSYYGEDANEDKALSVEYLENNIRLAIHRPASGGDYKYDYKSGNEIFLREKAAKTLSRFIRKAMKARDEGNEFTPLAISSASNLVEVSFGDHHGCNTDICITIYNNIDPETKKSDNYATFGFRNTSIVSNYNASDGSYESMPIDADISYFADQLSEFAKASTNAYAHANKKEFKFDMDRIISRQLEICGKLGIKNESINSSKVSWNSYDNQKDSVIDTSDIVSVIDVLE